ncbi:MAG: hypothetical protein JOY55_09700 [Mycobacterium sp.]|nr:hypothetical protein [Mycobacterium sp.]
MNRALPHLRTRRQWLAWLLLPALLLRALIPTGFMPVAGAGGLHLGFCPGAGELPPGVAAPATHASHPGHAHHEGGGRGIPGNPHHPACLFSAVATAAFAAPPADAIPGPALTSLTERIAAPVFLPAILRAQSPRGPPIAS